MELRIVVHDERVQSNLGRLPDRVAAEVERALWRGAQEVARAARRGAPKAFTTLTNSIHASREGVLHYRVAPAVSYARSVEEGRRPGVMPGTANGLTEWVRQKTGLAGPALNRATFAIARAIGRRGIRPQPYMAPALERNVDRVHQLVRDAVARGLESGHV